MFVKKKRKKVFLKSKITQNRIYLKGQRGVRKYYDYDKLDELGFDEVYDKEKDQFIESINMWIDCKYSKVYNDSKLIKAQLQAEDGEVRLACRVLFKTVDLYYQFLKDAVEKKETYSIELNVMGKHLYDTLYGDKKVIGTCEECGATTAVTDDTPSNTENTEPVAVKVDESKLLEDDTPTIADASYIPKKFYRQTAGSYNDGK